MTDFRVFVAVFIVSGVVAAFPLGAAGKLQTRHVFVHVVDQRGAPVIDLTPTDFQLTEGGVARVVTAAGPARDPMRIALFLDTSDAAPRRRSRISEPAQSRFSTRCRRTTRCCW